MASNPDHPWSSEDPGDDEAGIAELNAALTSVVAEPTPHVERLRAIQALLDESEDPASEPFGPGGRIELVEGASGEVTAVLAGEIICRDADIDAVRTAVRELGAEVVDREINEATGLARITLSDGAAVTAALAACSNAGVVAGPNEVTIEARGMRAKALSSPEPTTRQLGHRPTHGPGQGITVAVIDGGFATDTSQRNDGWLDDVSGPDQPVDRLDGDNVPGLDFGAGHGTFVTGTLRQVAPMCTVRQYRAVGTAGLGNAWVLMFAILQAAADGCHIINLSLGFDSLNIPGGVSTTAALQVISQKVLVVAAAGNGGDTTPIYPAAQKGVIAVGALDAQLQPAEWSSRGPWVDVSCVGDGIISSFVEGTEEATAKPTATTFSGPDPIALWSGTSFAAPQVSGRLAGLLSEGMSPVEAIAAVRAEAIGDTGSPHPHFGYRLRIL